MTNPFNTNDLFIWGPIPMKYVYTSDFVDAAYLHPQKRYKKAIWPKALLLFQGGRGVFVCDREEFEQAGETAFVECCLDTNSRETLYKEWKDAVADLKDIEQTIVAAEFDEVSNNELLELWNTMFERMRAFWHPTTVFEIANYGSANILRNKLAAVVPEASVEPILQTLSAIEAPSFYTEEEIALWKANDQGKHAMEYGWLQNSYAGSRELSVEYFKERRKELGNPQAEYEKHVRDTRAQKEVVIERFSLTPEILEVAQALTQIVEWLDERKKYVLQHMTYTDILLSEVGKRLGVSTDVLADYAFWEVAEFLENEVREVAERSSHGTLFTTGARKEYSAEEAEELWQVVLPAAEAPKHFSGTVACKGSQTEVEGVVRIVLDPHNPGEFNEGDILVAPMTSPEYIFVMKKASAILTDTGGLTSHAAVVSRELNIPCIVATKHATALHNGSRVRINSEEGAITQL